MWESPVLPQRRQQRSGCIPGVNISSALRFPLHGSPALQRAGCKQRAGAHIDLGDGSTEALSRGAAGPSQPAKVAPRGDTKHHHSLLFQVCMASGHCLVHLCIKENLVGADPEKWHYRAGPSPGTEGRWEMGTAARVMAAPLFFCLFSVLRTRKCSQSLYPPQRQEIKAHLPTWTKPGCERAPPQPRHPCLPPARLLPVSSRDLFRARSHMVTLGQCHPLASNVLLVAFWSMTAPHSTASAPPNTPQHYLDIPSAPHNTSHHPLTTPSTP